MSELATLVFDQADPSCERGVSEFVDFACWVQVLLNLSLDLGTLRWDIQSTWVHVWKVSKFMVLFDMALFLKTVCA